MTEAERQNIEKTRQVIGALSEGRLPTTEQAAQGISSIQQSGVLHNAAQGMSPAGQKVVADAERILEDTRRVAQQTMPNNELQNAIYYGNRSASRAASRSDLSADEARSVADTLVKAGAQSANLAKLIVTSSEFRTLLTDISSIAQELVQSNVVDATDDLANDPNAPDAVRQYAAKARDTVSNNDLQASGEQGLSNAQDSLRKGQDEAGRRAEEARIRANEVGQEARAGVDNARNTAGDSLASGASIRETAKNVVDAVANEAERRLPADQVDKASAAIREHGAALHQGQESTSGYRQQAQAQGQQYLDQGRALANQAASQIKDPNSQVRQTGERVARKLANLPEDKKRELLTKIKAVATIIQSKPEFQNSIDDLISLIGPLAYAAKDVTSTVVDKAATAPTDPQQIQASKDSRKAIDNAKQLIENFANGHSLDPIVKELRALAAESKDDDELRVYYTDLGAYTHRVIREPGFAENNQDFERDAGGLVERGRQVIEKYNYRFGNISYEVRNFSSALAANKTTQRLQKDTSALISDLFLDEKGNPTFKPDLVRDLSKLVPILIDRLAYLPVPRIEVDDGTYHMIMDNIVIKASLLPKYVRIVTDTTLDGTQAKLGDQLQGHIFLELSQIQASARDIAWLFHKQKGFFKAGDVGLADFDIDGKGLNIKVKITPADKHTDGRYLNVADVDVTLNGLDVRLHDSKHDILYKLAKPIINKTAKTQIQNAIADSLRDIIVSLDDKLGDATGGTGVGAPNLPEPKSGVPSEWGSKAFNA